MTKKTKFTFTTADGETATRTSARAYTHVIVGRKNYAYERQWQESPKLRKERESSWDYAKNCASVQPGERYPVARLNFEVTQERHDSGRALIEQHPSRDAYVAAKTAEAIAEVGEGDAGPLVVLQWSQSVSAATRAQSGFAPWYTGVHVLPINGEQPAENAPAPLPAPIAQGMTGAERAQVERAVVDAIELVDSVAFVREEGDNTADVLDRLRDALAIIQRT